MAVGYVKIFAVVYTITIIFLIIATFLAASSANICLLGNVYCSFETQGIGGWAVLLLMMWGMALMFGLMGLYSLHNSACPRCHRLMALRNDTREVGSHIEWQDRVMPIPIMGNTSGMMWNNQEDPTFANFNTFGVMPGGIQRITKVVPDYVVYTRCKYCGYRS